jgi:hypothetical protein
VEEAVALAVAFVGGVGIGGLGIGEADADHAAPRGVARAEVLVLARVVHGEIARVERIHGFWEGFSLGL